jgi:hypothetical protein
MNDEDDLILDDDFGEDEAPEKAQKRRTGHNSDTRRLLEDRLEASRLQRQTQDYDFDLD